MVLPCYHMDSCKVGPRSCSKCLTPSLAARKKDYIFSLREGERLKFQRDGVRDSDTKITKSGKDIIRSINSKNMALIPVPILPGGSTHGLFSDACSWAQTPYP